MMWSMSPNLRIKLGKKRFLGKRSHFLCFSCKREREKEIEEIKLLSSIYGVTSIGIRRVKNESSSTRRELRVGTENTGFHGGFKRGVWEIKGFGFRKCRRDFLEFLLRSKR